MADCFFKAFARLITEIVRGRINRLNLSEIPDFIEYAFQNWSPQRIRLFQMVTLSVPHSYQYQANEMDSLGIASDDWTRIPERIRMKGDVEIWSSDPTAHGSEPINIWEIDAIPQEVKRSQFDEQFYQLVNADVRRAIRTGSLSSGWEHWMQAGRKEHRMYRFFSSVRSHQQNFFVEAPDKQVAVNLAHVD